jgi:hypothetical protein
MTTTDFIATLALVIAAATFALQIKQWFDSGPKIHLSIIADAMEIPRGDGLPKLALTATNRGSERTQITHMVAYGYANWWKRFRHRPHFAAIVNSTNVPAFVEPKAYWMGMANYRPEITTLRTKQELYVGVVMTHRKSHYLIRVPLPQSPIESIKEG